MYPLAILMMALVVTSQQCHESDSEMFITFHPHLDAFWLNTDEQLKNINFRPAGFLYAMNQRNSKTIFNSMLDALLEAPNRKYFVTEVVFFKDWYDYLNEEKKDQVSELLKNGQLEIANGGWVENDEAICYYDDIIDQYTIGMNFLHEKFKYIVKIGWATDSFGHSHSQAALEHILGIQFQGIERVDDRYVHQHKNGPLLEFYWQAISDSNNKTYGGVLNQVRHFLHEVNNLRGGRTNYITSDFRKVRQTMEKMFNKNKSFRFLGNDFEEFIPQQFKNLEAGMDELNKEQQSTCPVFKYGNPSDYLNIITNYYNKNKVPVRKYDFMPNWDQDRYWSGYYTSDPQLKKICKDFSRLVNLFRKMLLKQFPKVQVPPILETAEELLSVMQHHDGITATSKGHIEEGFKMKMRSAQKQILKEMSKLYNIQAEGDIICTMYTTNNECQIKETNVDSLYIITHGNMKRQKVELKLPPNVFFRVKDVEYDIFCDNQNCKLLFDAVLYPGINEFCLEKITRQETENKIFVMEKQSDFTFAGRDYHISLNPQNGQVKYEFNDGQYITYSLHTSQNAASSRQSMSWDKYGSKSIKTQRVVPGIYIMSNSGTLKKLQQVFTEMKVSEGSIYIKTLMKSSVITLELTIKKDQPNIIDYVLDFKPPDRSYIDYFVMLSSTVKSDSMYHDSNGYLVSKREKNYRPDYDWEPKRQDLINANTYPTCTFAYMVENSKKFLLFVDRAHGVAMFEKSLLLNIDRLDMDDGKGVGEGYTKQVQNKFHHKAAIISEKDNLERLWQRQYDEGSIGLVTNTLQNTPEKVHRNNYYQSNKNKYAKYSIFYLNDKEIVLRLHNLAETQTLQLLKYRETDDGYNFLVEEIGLNINCKDIKESYANGIVKSESSKKHWGVGDQINTLNAGSNDKDGLIILRPLQIRSFRINFSEKIVVTAQKPANPSEDLTVVNMQHAKQMHPTSPRKRCF